MTATAPEFWTELAEAVRRPESLAALDDAAFPARVDLLRDYAALPIILWGLGKGDAWQALPSDRRERLAREEGRYKGAAAVLWPEFEAILDRWADEGLTPCLLKGAHAALAFYPAPYLRPMSDVDALFTDLGEAERAYEILKRMGFTETAIELGGDHWATHHHLTALENRATGFAIEVHGSMIYPPKDKRAVALACLWEEMANLDVSGRHARGLSPEAFVVITFAHALVAHGAEPPKFQAILDVAQMLKVTGGAFRWERLAELSATAGFAGAVSLGLRWTRNLLGSAIPEGFAERLAEQSSDRDKASGLVGDDYNNARFLETLRQAQSLSARVGIVRHLTFPPGVWMRARYPEKARWPVLALYPYRWTDQTRKVLRVLWAKLFS